MRLCALIPAYNAAAHIGGVVERTRPHVDLVLVIDDGSTDGTGEQARAAGAIVHRHSANRGKGAALKTGFALVLERGFDGVLTLDADGQHDPDEIPELLAHQRKTNAPIIVGARLADRRTMPLHRRLNNGLVSAVGTWLSGQSVPDFQCGFRLLRADVLRCVVLETAGYETESELLIRAGRLGFRIESVPIRTIYDGEESHVRPLREMLRFTRLLFRSLSDPSRRDSTEGAPRTP